MSDREIHILTCKRDFEDFLLTIKTFYLFNKVNWKLVVHSDGSLGPSEASIIKDTIENCRIVSLEEAQDVVLPALKPYKYCYEIRRDYLNTHIKQMFLKVFDPLLLCDSNYYITLDSDVFTYDRCDRLIALVNDQTPFYHGGGWGCLKYPVSIEKLHKEGFKPVGNLNAGLIGISKDMFDLELCDRFYKLLKDNPNQISKMGMFYTGEEEPLFSCLMGACVKHKVLWAGPHDYFTPEYAKYGPNEKYYGIGQHPNVCVLSHFVGNTFLELGRKHARLKLENFSGKINNKEDI